MTGRVKLTEAQKKAEFDRGLIVGVGLACSIIISNYDEPRMIASALEACCLDRRKLKKAGVEDYDLKALKPVFAELSSTKRRRRRHNERRVRG